MTGRFYYKQFRVSYLSKLKTMNSISEKKPGKAIQSQDLIRQTMHAPINKDAVILGSQ